MIVGLKELIPYVLKVLPETHNDAIWLKTKLLDSREVLSNCCLKELEVTVA